MRMTVDEIIEELSAGSDVLAESVTVKHIVSKDDISYQVESRNGAGSFADIESVRMFVEALHDED